MVWSRGHSEGAEGQFSGHLVVGDLNPTSWKEGYQRWLAEGGAWELTDPGKSTHKRGGALDKILFQPWEHIRDCFLGDTNDREEGDNWGGMGDEEKYYPAITIPVRMLSDHHPIILRLPYKKNGGGSNEGQTFQTA